MKTFENEKFDVDVRTKIMKPNLLHDLLHGVDSTMCKQRSIASCWNVSQILLQNQLLEYKYVPFILR